MADVSYTTRELVIPAGGSIETFRDASFVTCLEAQAPFKIAFEGGQSSDFEAGLTLTPSGGLRTMELRNTGATDNRVKLAFGKGEIQDSRLTLGGSIAANIEPGDMFNTPLPVSAGDAAVTLLAAANSNRAELILANDGAGKVYIGGTAAAVAGQGLPLAVGQALSLDTSAAVYARNDSGSAVSICVAEIERGA
ncbi:hypothetical protein SAMN06297129_2449 [Pseudooceanicola antarcticus]|uniref:Uncharacterized protein n=1 Tax=Pseudooceanicola antarcticus TaxID=1247613 RepID=A0A285IY22_9RHOB|nr:hypothetical protein [Pseudooceanicola antarcticus]PJE25764.1 hypothetical protein CVM39_18845 [Pseudooceanicola antarcticus]SNY52950.1 hypothetical protein SAMN06297129_2449 [Pseudooceanicola antarcticus]